MFKINILLVFVLWTQVLHAELPPSVYENMQKSAPESLHILVLEVKKDSSLFGDTHVTIKAKVTHIYQSKGNVKKEDIIKIKYTTKTSFPPGWVGPSSLPILKEKETYPAYLQKDKMHDFFTPAARGKSFK